MKTKFQFIDIRTHAGMRKAEKLQSKGYNFHYVGLDRLMFEIQKPIFTNQTKKQ